MRRGIVVGEIAGLVEWGCGGEEAVANGIDKNAFADPAVITARKLGVSYADIRSTAIAMSRSPHANGWHPELPGSQSAQGGLPAQKIYLVRNGVLENLVYSRFWVQQKDKEPTPDPVNSIIESSQSPVSIDDMIKSMDRGLLLGRFWYIRGVDPRIMLQTGLTRDGIWYIENGKIQ